MRKIWGYFKNVLLTLRYIWIWLMTLSLSIIIGISLLIMLTFTAIFAILLFGDPKVAIKELYNLYLKDLIRDFYKDFPYQHFWGYIKDIWVDVDFDDFDVWDEK